MYFTLHGPDESSIDPTNRVRELCSSICNCTVRRGIQARVVVFRFRGGSGFEIGLCLCREDAIDVVIEVVYVAVEGQTATVGAMDAVCNISGELIFERVVALSALWRHEGIGGESRYAA